jgi:hypothetical protein
MYRLLFAVLLPMTALSQDDIWDDEEWEEGPEAAVWTGFIEAGLGTRLQSDPLQDDRNTLGELRWRVETERTVSRYSLGLKADVGYDEVENDGFADLRDLTLSFSLGDSLDLKLGHQVQTWATGDLLFLNDLFPKDFVSFFAGRDDEYLKAPGTAIRLTHFGPVVNVDFVWTPVFEPDNYLTGERFSFFSPLAGTIVAPEPPLAAAVPEKTFANGEFALRLFRTVAGREVALYAYRGYFKQPSALTPDLEPAFAPLSVYGASLRQPAGPGVMNAEFAWYASRDDDDGTDPLIPNDQVRLLAGYEWEAAPRFTVGLQYYLEWTLDYGELLAGTPTPSFAPEEYRQLLTNRLTYRSGRERYTWSLFTFFSPTDRDVYLRPQMTLRYSDTWTFVAGGNLFAGAKSHTFFGQFEDAGNVFLRLRFNY